METIATITQKGQITLPMAMRVKFGLKPYGKVKLSADKNHIKVSPTEDIINIAGSFKPEKVKPVMAARNIFEKKYRRF